MLFYSIIINIKTEIVKWLLTTMIIGKSESRAKGNVSLKKLFILKSFSLYSQTNCLHWNNHNIEECRDLKTSFKETKPKVPFLSRKAQINV